MFQWTKKNRLSHFNLNCLGSRYPIRSNTRNMTNVAENRRLRLSDAKGSKVVSEFNLKCHRVRLRFIGTHFDQNRYIVWIFFFFSIGPYEAMQKFRTPRTGGFRYFFINHFNLLLVTPSMFKKWGKINQNFPIYISPFPDNIVVQYIFNMQDSR